MADPAAIARPVLVVGAGPVGVTAALALRAAGLPVSVLEAGAKGRVRPGSRAPFVHRQSLRLLERARPGLGQGIAAYGTTWRTRRTLYRGRQVFAQTFPEASGRGALPAFASLRQADTERFLYEACLDARADFRFDAAG
jgi:3-(3-hydroxy-phenyl)propionate hydroxylase